MAEGGDERPGLGGFGEEVVVGCVGEEGRVAMAGGVCSSVLLDGLFVGLGELGA